MEKGNVERPQIMRLPQVKARTGLSRSNLYAYMRRGQFPTPVLLGTRAVGWIDAEVEAWLAVRIQARQGSAS